MTTATITNAELLKRREAAVPRGMFFVAPVFAERAENARIWDVEGKEYIDFCGGIGVVNVGDRKSTRLNSSHVKISYAVFCLKKKKKQTITQVAARQA